MGNYFAGSETFPLAVPSYSSLAFWIFFFSFSLLCTEYVYEVFALRFLRVMEDRLWHIHSNGISAYGVLRTAPRIVTGTLFVWGSV